MPFYDFKCGACGLVQDRWLPMDRRHEPGACEECEGEMLQRMVAMPQVLAFEPHYDEGLGSDVYSWEDRKRVMRRLGVEEAGDPVHGGRNFDKGAPEKVGKMPLQGRRYVERPPRDQVVEVVDGRGETLDRKKWSELD